MAKKSRYAHNTVKTRQRHYQLVQTRPRRDRFTYSGTTVNGQAAITFFIDNTPLFKQPIVCSRNRALSLVRKLNAIPRQQLETQGNEIIRSWFTSLEEASVDEEQETRN